MSFLGSSSKNSGTGSGMDTLIGRQTEIHGDVHFAGGLHVDGKITGNVCVTTDGAGSLSVSDTGVIQGDVRVPAVMLNGAVIGELRATERLTLSAKARVNGNVYYKLLQIEPGAVINGQLVCEGAEPAAITHQKSPEGKTEATVVGIQGARQGRSG